jgi:two-component system, chemotaxis family, CheB/CheR fusion protein
MSPLLPQPVHRSPSSRSHPSLPSTTGSPRDADLADELGGLRVLVVEDDPDIRELLASILTHAGAVVESAESAASGFDTFCGFRPQLLVSDIGMPFEDGYSFIRRVRALGADAGGLVPSIALTAFTGDRDRAQALRAGFTLHMGKPVGAFEFVCAVKNLAEGQRSPSA